LTITNLIIVLIAYYAQAVITGRRDLNGLIDTESANRKFEKELKSGTAALLLLGVISAAGRPMYGYQITKEIEAAGGGKGDGSLFRQGALYPVLRSMEKSGILSSEIEPSVSGPPRRYYSITEDGGEILDDWKSTWKSTRDLVDGILRLRDKGQPDTERI
jgi:PadR family transcriptional regulator, regulatory protein PadR